MSRRGQPRDLGELRARRRSLKRERGRARLDVVLGIVGAAILVLATPGLAITALLALGLIIACFASVALERRARRRSAGARPRRRRRSVGVRDG